jgi:8-oxo-dGTP pyrophosphatase MutT (NUDIX family)
MYDPRLAPVHVYLRHHPDHPAHAWLKEQLTAPPAAFSRNNMSGHITASGLVLTADHSEVLLVAHLGSGKWLQPGGHVDDDDPAIWQAAAREIREETGVTGWHDEHDGQPIDIDTHAIAARLSKGEGDHWHHDCLYVFVVERTPVERQEEEVSAVSWCKIDDDRVSQRLLRVYGIIHGQPSPRSPAENAGRDNAHCVGHICHPGLDAPPGGSATSEWRMAWAITTKGARYKDPSH